MAKCNVLRSYDPRKDIIILSEIKKGNKYGDI
jgi:hypothetical protein